MVGGLSSCSSFSSTTACTPSLVMGSGAGEEVVWLSRSLGLAFALSRLTP